MQVRAIYLLACCGMLHPNAVVRSRVDIPKTSMVSSHFGTSLVFLFYWLSPVWFPHTTVLVQCFCFTGYDQYGFLTLQYQPSVSVLQAMTSMVSSHYSTSPVFLFYRLSPVWFTHTTVLVQCFCFTGYHQYGFLTLQF